MDANVILADRDRRHAEFLDGVQGEVEVSADRARGRGGWENEQAFLQRAAQLTADPERRAARRLAAAEADPRRAHDTMLEAFSAAPLDGWFEPESSEVAAVATALIPLLFSLGYNHLRAGRLSAEETALAEGRALAEGAGNREWLDGFDPPRSCCWHCGATCRRARLWPPA